MGNAALARDCVETKTARMAPGRDFEIGRDDWIRTSDPLTPSQVRYQAAPHPDSRSEGFAPEPPTPTASS